jgi:hypothetical protein
LEWKYVHPIDIKNKVKKDDKTGVEIVAEETRYKKSLFSDKGRPVADRKFTIFLDDVSTIEEVQEISDEEPGNNYRQDNEYWFEGEGSDDRKYWVLVLSKEEDERKRLEEMNQYIVNSEKAGRYEDAARACEDLGMFEKAGQLRRKAKEMTVVHVDVNSLVRQLAERGQTLTYYCCHCGAPLKIGAKSVEVPKTCPHCGYSLEFVDLAKFINQHLS